MFNSHGKRNIRRTPESALWAAVIALAIEDLQAPSPELRDSALRFFQSKGLDMVVALTRGVDQDVIPRLRKQALLLYNQPPRKTYSKLLRHIITGDDGE